MSLSRATARRNVVLQAMLDEGIITRAAFDRSSREKIELRDTLRRQEPIGQYFKEEVRQQLVKQFGWPRISEGGLRVYTTIDPEMQRAAEAAIAQTLQQIELRQRKRARAAPIQKDPLQAALVAIDPSNGEVRAMVGGRDFSDSRFNRAMQAHRQPGSAFKPFVYAAALESGFSPASMIDNLDAPISTLQGAWIPEDEHSVAPAMTMRTALRTSSNRAAVQMLQTVGIAKTVGYARAHGHRQRAQRAVAGAGVRRGDADVDDVGLLGRSRRPASGGQRADQACRRSAGARSVPGRTASRSRYCHPPQHF